MNIDDVFFLYGPRRELEDKIRVLEQQNEHQQR